MVVSLVAAVNEMDTMVVAKVSGRSVTRAELANAFALVENKENWKLPIDAVVVVEGPEELEVIKQAVTFFAGCTAVTEPVEPKVCGRTRYWRVTAPGYYAAVGA